MTRLFAAECEFDVLLSMQRTFEADDPETEFAGSTHWCRAASQVAPIEAFVPVMFLDDREQPVGVAMLMRGKSDWRSGSPGKRILRWPFQEFGYHFGPIWHPDIDNRRNDWLPALTTAFPDAHFVLERCAPMIGTCPDDLVRTEGPVTWSLVIDGGCGNGLERWKTSLKGDHRRDLDYYRKRIDRSACDWVDMDLLNGNTAGPLESCFNLHERRVAAKGMTSAYLTAEGRAFIAALVDVDPSSARISKLTRNGRLIGTNLSFVHNGHYRCFMPGWDPAERRLDLGRQMIYHQIIGEFERGLSTIDLLGGDHAYKREFGLADFPTTNLQSRPSRGEAARRKLVESAIHLIRKIRRS